MLILIRASKYKRMNKKILTIALLTFSMICCFSQEKTLTRGLKITKTTKIKKAVYKLDGYDSLNKSAIIIEGNNITVDFNNCTLRGSNGKKNPDEYFGVAVLIRNGNN